MQNAPPGPSAGAGDLRLVTALPPAVAFSHAIAHLMVRPAFARAPFGHIARCVAGQVNRGHYAFAVRDPEAVGFAGWAKAVEPAAQAWLDGERGFPDAEATTGDCVILNFWQADSPEVSRFLVHALTALLPGTRRVYAKRHYPDGRMRPLVLEVGGRRDAPEPVPATARARG